MNGPPRDNSRYPGMYPSNERLLANANRVAPAARQKLPIIPATRGPYVSKIVPMGKAETLVATAAMVNIKFSLIERIDQQVDLQRWTLSFSWERKSHTESLGRHKRRHDPQLPAWSRDYDTHPHE